MTFKTNKILLQKHFTYNKRSLVLWSILFTIVFCLGFVFRMQKHDIKYDINQYNVITSDGIGYYSYLPSTFIKKEHQISDNQDHYINFDRTPGNKQNKYFVGTSILMAPFFITTHLITKTLHAIHPNESYRPNGYTFPYQLAICFAGVFYLILGLFYFKKLATKLSIKREIIFFLIILFALGTQLLELASYESSFSHIYAFFTISISLYICNEFTRKPRLHYFLGLVFFLSLLLLIRPTDILIALCFPIFILINGNSKQIISWFLKQRVAYLYTLLIGGGLLFIQLYYWKLQSGSFILWTYTDEGFDFSSPAFFEVLFSYKKGLFVYAPLLFISLIIILLSKLDKWLKIWFLIFFIANNYVISSWWCWWYGGSLGMRPWMDFIPIILILLGLALNQFHFRVRSAFYLTALFCIPLNIVYSYQYSWGIMHWDSMNYEKYWQTFMKTSSDFDFITYDPSTPYKDYKVIDSITVNIRETEKINIIDKNNMFITLFEAQSDSIFSNNYGTYVKVEFDGKVEFMRASANLTCNKNLKNSTENIQKSKRIIQYIRSSQKWMHKEIVFDFGKGRENESDFSIFLYNNQLNKFWFKNFKVTFYNYFD